MTRSNMFRLVLVGLVFAAPAAAGFQAVPPSRVGTDPAADLVAVRVSITTAAETLDLTVEHVVLANAVFTIRGNTGVRATYSGNTIRVTGNRPPERADVRADLILAGATEGSRLAWTLGQDPPGLTAIHIDNLNTGTPVRVDELRTTAASARFVTDTDALRARGPLPPPDRVPPKVLAFYYPWYELGTWSSPELLDIPSRLYSTEDPVDAARTARLARSAGLDALAVSWQGKTYDGGWNHRRMQVMLDAAREAGLAICVLLETTVANPQHDQSIPPESSTVLGWLSEIIDSYGGHPAYLRVNGRPVVFAYAGQRLSADTWEDVLRRLRAGGRDLLLIGEGSNNTRLRAFDGLFFYGSNIFQADEVRGFHASQSLAARTYHLLPTGGPRRLWVATVSPGYDDTRLRDGRIPRVTPRDDGRYYDRQWQSAIDMRADWVVITSWNEWWENTHVEPSRFFGAAYLERTQEWASAYRRGAASHDSVGARPQ